MTKEPQTPGSHAIEPSPEEFTGEDTERPPLSPPAQRALQEAEERRRTRDAAAKPAVPEIGGRSGPDPVRYGDWESGGITSDF
jgi:hypothetical protein